MPMYVRNACTCAPKRVCTDLIILHARQCTCSCAHAHVQTLAYAHIDKLDPHAQVFICLRVTRTRTRLDAYAPMPPYERNTFFHTHRCTCKDLRLQSRSTHMHTSAGAYTDVLLLVRLTHTRTCSCAPVVYVRAHSCLCT